MAKPETDFVEDDFAMARRAQWLLDDHVPGREQPPPDLDLNRFGAFVGAGGFLEPLAHFGQRRRDDALLAAKRSAAAAPMLEAALPHGAPRARNCALSEACASEKRVNDELREARAHIRNARRHWLRASELRADADDKIAVLALHGAAAVLSPTGEHQAILEAISSLEMAMDGAVAALEPSLRRLIVGDPFPGR
jgi:hypothetical protein